HQLTATAPEVDDRQAATGQVVEDILVVVRLPVPDLARGAPVGVLEGSVEAVEGRRGVMEARLRGIGCRRCWRTLAAVRRVPPGGAALLHQRLRVADRAAQVAERPLRALAELGRQRL